MRVPTKPEPSSRVGLAASLPLPTLLSQVLVAFTIEFDNEFEHQIPHRTTSHGSTSSSPDAPWLVSLVMWSNFMRFVPDDGLTVGDLQHLTGLTKKGMHMWLARMGTWWGYIVVEHDPTDSRPGLPGPGWLVRPTPAGRRAQRVWRTLFGVIEKRWQARFGEEQIARLRESLSALASQLDIDLPEYPPVLGAVWSGWFVEILYPEGQSPAVRDGNLASPSASAGAPFSCAARLHPRLRARLGTVARH